jgi:Domain of unknown function (DUF2703)
VDTAVRDGVVAAPAATHQLAIDFMYLDLETCTRCRGTDANLEAALAEVGRVLEAAGAEVSVRKTLVASAEQARALGFVSSPTIRVNGTDLALELRESSCAECGEACACDGTIDCRVWVWQGQEHTAAPTPMIVDAILRGIYGGGERAIAPLPVGAVPENLARFFAGKERLAATASCCPPAAQVACCEPSEKASCCGDGVSGSCGCQ